MDENNSTSNELKKIIIVWSEPLDNLRGGIHRCINILLKHLPAKGYDVQYFYTLDHYNTFYSLERKALTREGLKKYLIDNQINCIIGQEAVWDDAFTRLTKQFNLTDLKVINQYHSTLAYFPKKLSFNYLRSQWKHDSDIKNRISIATRYVLYPFWKYNVKKKQNKIYKYNYYNNDISVLLTSKEKPILRKITNDQTLKKSFVINNPLSWDYIASPDILKQKEKEVLIVSRIYNCEKRIDLALRVWKIIEQNRELQDWKLRIIGDGIDKDYLIEYAKSLNLRNVIWESTRDPKANYEKASIFLMTSVSEGWGLTLTESLQNGVVPLAFNSFSAASDIIRDGYNGYLIKPFNVKKMSQELIRLMSNDKLRAEVSLNCLKSAERFRIDKIMDRWDKLLSQLIQS